MDGIINVLKPTGMTSFDVVGYLRSVLRMKKIGHTGTLDPAAAGVLPVCTGKATKAIEFLMNKDKVYRAELTLGIETDTQDGTGRVIRKKEVSVSESRIEDALKSFVGSYNQIPPMYSALKVDGKKLYELARSGIEVERNAREVKVHFVNILDVKSNRVIFDVGCSKGTYIRTLCSDIGEKLGCGGHMSFLVRTKSGVFNISDSLTLEEIKNHVEEDVLDRKVIGVEKVFSDYNEIVLNLKDTKRFMNGVAIKIEDKMVQESGFLHHFAKRNSSKIMRVQDSSQGFYLRIYDESRKFLALGEVIYSENGLYLKSRKFFASSDLII